MIDYSNFQMSLKNLEEQYERFLALDPSWPIFVQEAMSESVIQRFEVCYDSMWKVLGRYLRDEMGIPDTRYSPNPIFRMADENNLLASPLDQWLDYVEARMGTTHDYSGEKAEYALELIANFLDDAIGLYQTLTGETWE